MKKIIYMAICVLMCLAATVSGEDGTDFEFEQELPAVASTNSANNTIPWLKGSTTPVLTPVLPEKATVSSWRSFGALLVVLGCLWAATWFLKKRVGKTGLIGNSRRMRVIERLSLGQRQYLALINVDGAEVLLGVSAERIVELGLTRDTIAQNCAAGDETAIAE